MCKSLRSCFGHLRKRKGGVHELGVVIEVVKTVEDFARRNGLTKVDTLVLQIGELSAIIPSYVESCFPAAVDGTLLQDTKLRIEVTSGNAVCKDCGDVFNVIRDKKRCPSCGGGSWELQSGKEFIIKEIIAC